MKIPIDIKTGNIISEPEKEVIVGIDLGTTNSLIAYIADGQPVTIKSQNGKNSLTPSVLHFTNQGEIIVGDRAKDFLISDPANTIFSVKRLMGKSYSDLEKLKTSIGYEIIDEDKESLVKVRVGDTFYSPIELSAEILKSLKQDAENLLNKTIQKAVITVPAYFNDAQRQATRDAGKLAGLDVLRIVNEPTAASLAYGIGVNTKHEHHVVVYDLGGGTFDVSILYIGDGIFEVLSTHGDTFLGGDDFDRLIIQHWANQIDLSEEDLKTDKALNQSIRLAAEDAKKALSQHDYFATEINGYHISLDKSTFDQLVEPLVAKTLESCTQAMKDAGMTNKDIHKVILVGGSTRMPIIKERLADFFGQQPDDTLHPDEVVALGAAVQADILSGSRKDILLLDVTPLSLGIETVGGLMDTIIPRNAKVPQSAGRQYTTSVDGQKNLRVSVYQGERDLVENNRKLGEFTLKNIPPMPAGIPKIEVQFMLNADGILKVKAAELRSGTETTVEIKSAYGISEEEMALMLIDSLQNAESDIKKRALLESINEANNVLLATSKFLTQNVQILDISEIEKIKLLAAILENAIQTKVKNDIELAMKALNDYSSPIAQRALDINISHALKGNNILTT
ncbi:MAG: molecular chaperone DnaK [Saprospiraceae bacterium]